MSVKLRVRVNQSAGYFDFKFDLQGWFGKIHLQLTLGKYMKFRIPHDFLKKIPRSVQSR
jgi:hypothetical protein